MWIIIYFITETSRYSNQSQDSDKTDMAATYTERHF